MADRDEPTIEYYTVEVQKPDSGGWTTVHTDDVATGRSAHDAAWGVLRFRWPVSIYDKGDDRGERRRAALAGTAGYRLVITPAAHNRRGSCDRATITVAEVVLGVVTDQVTERRAARQAVGDAREALERARSREWLANHDLKQAVAEAALTGVSEQDINHAKRAQGGGRRG